MTNVDLNTLLMFPDAQKLVYLSPQDDGRSRAIILEADSTGHYAPRSPVEIGPIRFNTGLRTETATFTDNHAIWYASKRGVPHAIVMRLSDGVIIYDVAIGNYPEEWGALEVAPWSVATVPEAKREKAQQELSARGVSATAGHHLFARVLDSRGNSLIRTAIDGLSNFRTPIADADFWVWNTTAGTRLVSYTSGSDTFRIHPFGLPGEAIGRGQIVRGVATNLRRHCRRVPEVRSTDDRLWQFCWSFDSEQRQLLSLSRTTDDKGKDTYVETMYASVNSTDESNLIWSVYAVDTVRNFVYFGTGHNHPQDNHDVWTHISRFNTQDNTLVTRSAIADIPDVTLVADDFGVAIDPASRRAMWVLAPDRLPGRFKARFFKVDDIDAWLAAAPH